MIFQEFMDLRLPRIETLQWAGRVREMVGMLIASEVRRRPWAISAKFDPVDGHTVRAQVVGFRDGRVLLMPLEETGGLQLGDAWWRVPRPRGWRWARNCWGACSTASESRWTDGRRSTPTLPTTSMRHRPGRSNASTSPNLW